MDCDEDSLFNVIARSGATKQSGNNFGEIASGQNTKNAPRNDIIKTVGWVDNIRSLIGKDIVRPSSG